jgi:alcohol dehydrogenase (cytochrome c)
MGFHAYGRALPLTLAGALISSVFVAPVLAESPVTNDRLVNADSEPQNWLTTLQDYASHRYSRLDEINRDNVANLHVAFTQPITSGLKGRDATNIDTNPLVDDGIMYFEDGAGVFYKLDVSAGNTAKLVWTADAAVAKDVPAGTRGFTLINNLVVQCLRDGRTVAVDRESGEFVWDVQRIGIEHPGSAGLNLAAERCSGGTTAMGGYVMVSNGFGDGGTRGFLEALNPETGDEVWRWYSIPAPGEPGHETWADDHNAWKTGGGGLWTQGSFDPQSRLTFWGTANPVPLFDPEFRPGDNLYTDSVVALNIDDGKLAWYFQYVPNDSWDYDENGVHFIVDREVDGQQRQVLAHFGRNGHFYQFDRNTGAFMSASQYVNNVNWTAGIDPKTGKPVEYAPGEEIQSYIPDTRWLRGEPLASNAAACPHLGGGVRWQYPAYNPDTGIAYAAANDGCFKMEVLASVPAGPDGGVVTDPASGGLQGFNHDWNAAATEYYGAMWAVDLKTGNLIAKTKSNYAYLSGVTVTKGGLVLTSTPDGIIEAHDDQTLDTLWSFSTGIPSRGTPIAYSVNGKEYIAVLVGGKPSAGGGPNLTEEVAKMLPGAMLYVFTL